MGCFVDPACTLKLKQACSGLALTLRPEYELCTCSSRLLLLRARSSCRRSAGIDAGSNELLRGPRIASLSAPAALSLSTGRLERLARALLHSKEQFLKAKGELPRLYSSLAARVRGPRIASRSAPAALSLNTGRSERLARARLQSNKLEWVGRQS